MMDHERDILVPITDDMSVLKPIEDYEFYDAIRRETSKIAANVIPFADTVVAEKHGENYIYSPLSTWTCYMFLASGLHGEAKTRLLQQLESAEPLDPEFKDRAIAQLMDDMNRVGGALNLKNYLFVEKNLTVDPGFAKVAYTFRAGIYAMDLEHNVQVTDAINAMIERETYELIRDFYGQPIDPMTSTILMNIVAMNAKWKKPFDRDETQERPFTLSDGTRVKASMMHQENTFDWFENDIADVLKMDYETRDYIVFMLPKPDVTPEDVLHAWLHEHRLERAFEPAIVDVTMPRVSIESDWLLQKPLTDMGLGYLFTGGVPGMHGILENQEFLIADSRQKARIEIFEEGTKAAAVTDMIMRTAFIPPKEHVTLVFDRPYAFAVYSADDVELFRGVVSDPTPEF